MEVCFLFWAPLVVGGFPQAGLGLGLVELRLGWVDALL